MQAGIWFLQSRYVEYFEKVKRNYGDELPPPKIIKLKTIGVRNLQGTGNYIIYVSFFFPIGFYYLSYSVLV